MSASSVPAYFRIPPSKLDHAEFMKRFAGIYEHAAWVAEAVWKQGITQGEDEIKGMHSKMIEIVNNSGHNEVMTLILSHPDLAGKAALQGQLTAESSDEQSRAGLDQCTEEELLRFTQDNDAYKEKFGFPFIMAVRHSDRHAILAAFAERLQHTEEEELARAVEEIHKIALFRLQEL